MRAHDKTEIANDCYLFISLSYLKQQHKLQHIQDISERALEKELGLVLSPRARQNNAVLLKPQQPHMLPLPLPAPRAKPKPKLSAPSRNFVLDNALNLKAANELKLKKAQEADNRNARAFGPGARDIKKPTKEKEKRLSKQQNDADSIGRPAVQQAQSPPQPPPRQPSPPPPTLYSAPPTSQVQFAQQGKYLDNYGRKSQFGVKEMNGKRKPIPPDNDDISTMTPSVSFGSFAPKPLPFLPGKFR